MAYKSAESRLTQCNVNKFIKRYNEGDTDVLDNIPNLGRIASTYFL